MSSTTSIIKAVTDSKLAIVIHRNGAILFANQAAVETFGAKTFAEVGNKTVDDFVDPSFLTKVQGRRALFEAGEPLEAIVGTLLKIDGTPFAAAVTSFEIDHEGDKASLTIIIDIGHEEHQDTEIERLTNEIKQLTAVTIGREMRMEELKSVIEKLKRKPKA